MKINKFINKKILVSFLLISLSPIIVTILYLYLNNNLDASDIYWVLLIINSGLIGNYMFYPTIDTNDILSVIPIIFIIRYILVYIICNSINEKKAIYIFSLLIGLFTSISGFLLIIQTG